MIFEAYWAAVDWKAVGVFAGAVGTVASPFLADWWKFRKLGTASRAQVAESTAQRLERIANEQYARVEKEREYFKGRADEEAARADSAEAQGRAAEDWAHWYRHGWCEAATKYNRLSELFARLVKGDLAHESASVIKDQIMANPLLAPPPVPLLRAMTSTPPQQ